MLTKRKWFLPAMLLLLALSGFVQTQPDSVSAAADSIQALDAVSDDATTQLERMTENVSWTSVLPPLVAIVLALVFRQVLVALFVSIWLGAFLVGGGGIGSIFGSFFFTMNEYIVPAAADEDHMAIIMFSLMIGGMIGIISANGGTRGIIDLMLRFVKNRIQGQVMTALLGFVVFFDDYANTMIVGNTMRPIADKLKMTRAKLAYLVDSTAAPVATIAIISTWIGAMVAYIADAEAGIEGFNIPAYSVFLYSLPYNFYAWLTIAFVMMIAASGRDFGPMLHARITLMKAKHDPSLDKYKVYHEIARESEISEKKSHWLFAFIPIMVLVFGTILGLYVTGEGSTIMDIVGSANSYAALVWGSLAAMAVAIAMTYFGKLLDFEETAKGMLSGMHVMFDGLIILVLAWSLSKITQDLNTAGYLISVFGDVLNPLWVPVIVFVLAGLTSFATGTSWGTMGILMPLVIPLVWNLGMNAGLDEAMINLLIFDSVSSVLAGAVWGDHCSPISDTTILSSIASQCDHIEHVRTQLPYAMVVGFISILAGIMVTVIGFNIWVIYAISVSLLALVVWYFGRRVEPEQYMEAQKS
jgi:Na+/H+ antiporter NhaC